MTYSCNSDHVSFSGTDGSTTQCSSVVFPDGKTHSDAACIYSGSITHGAGAAPVGPTLCSILVGSSDPCANQVGDGQYCGSSTQTKNGTAFDQNNPNRLYTCQGGKTTNYTDCGACVVAQSGSDDYCANSGGGGGGGNQPTPTPMPSCTNGQDTKFALSLKLDGIGTGSFENSNPKRPNRTGQVRVFDAANSSSSINSSSQAFNYGSNDGKFASATIDLGTGLQCGSSYKVAVKLPGYLSATGDVKYGDTSQVISLEPLGGDINQVDNNGVIVGDGKIDINDYSIYRQCRNQDPTTSIPFQSNTKTINVQCGDLINFFDFQDGGTMESVLFTPPGGASVGEWDANYNLWLRWALQAGGL